MPAIALSIIPASNKTAHVTGSPQFELARCKGQQLLDTIALNTYRISDHQSTFEMSTDGWNVNKKSYDQDVQISNDFSLWYQMGIDMRNFVIYEGTPFPPTNPTTITNRSSREPTYKIILQRVLQPRSMSIRSNGELLKETGKFLEAMEIF